MQWTQICLNTSTLHRFLLKIIKKHMILMRVTLLKCLEKQNCFGYWCRAIELSMKNISHTCYMEYVTVTKSSSKWIILSNHHMLNVMLATTNYYIKGSLELGSPCYRTTCFRLLCSPPFFFAHTHCRAWSQAILRVAFKIWNNNGVQEQKDSFYCSRHWYY